MRRIIVGLLVTICIFAFSACDQTDSEDNVYMIDDLEYEEICFTEGTSAYWRVVKVSQKSYIPRNLHDNNEVVLGIYDDMEYFFMSNTEYNYYRIEIPNYEGEFFTLLEAKELHEFTVEFVVSWCSPFKISEPIYIRDVE